MMISPWELVLEDVTQAKDARIAELEAEIAKYRNMIYKIKKDLWNYPDAGVLAYKIAKIIEESEGE
jgi:hypothetical protein